MYLFRQSNSVYYTHVAIPTSLQKNGFPKEIRLSLATRDRRMAYKRNLDQTKVIFELFELAQTKFLPFPDFKQKLNAEINKLRVSFNKQTGDGDSTCRLLSETYEPKPNKQIPSITNDALNRFIESKRLEKVTNLTLKQLKQRNGDFLKFVEQQEGTSITSNVAMAYRDKLLGRGLSHM